MLALTRRKGESIMINENIEIVIIGIQGEQVKLGIIAPKDVKIHRREIYDQIQKENKLSIESLDKADIESLKNLLNEPC